MMLNKKEWLDHLYYILGNQQYDFRVSGLTKKDGKVISTKWKKYSLIVFPLEPWEKDKLYWVNNREILPNEVVIDLEEKTNIKKVVKQLKKDKLAFNLFDTHSRGYHIHIWFKFELNEEEKLKIIKRYGGDEQKAGKTPIALEWAKHWKSGKIKEEVMIKNGLG